MSVPGAEFPSFIEVAIPHVKQIEKMTISLGQQEYLGRETILRWQPGTDPNAYISIYFYLRGMSSADTYEGEESYGYRLIVSCIANDSGLFEYPDDTWDIISAHEVSL